ncbi:MAG: hypothetical protein H7257_13625 [Taibaiella sp.]|nr:hypothetical protein [Taibaiella sp.]
MKYQNIAMLSLSGGKDNILVVSGKGAVDYYKVKSVVRYAYITARSMISWA